MGRLQWMGLALCVASPAVAAEVRCGEDGGEIVGTQARQVLVSVDDQVHILRPAAGPGEPGSASDFCAGRAGLVAIVLPAPRPGPEDEVPDEAVELPILLEDLSDPAGLRAVGEPDEGQSSGEDAEDEGRHEPAPTLARTRSGALPPGLLEDELGGCQAGPSAPTGGLGLFLLGLIGLRRKRGAR
ncbi:MAG: hypothetical protein KC613_00730 [Myxococcales bacterium]|nr:hypothetical protein [Myxococcales bacterium]